MVPRKPSLLLGFYKTWTCRTQVTKVPILTGLGDRMAFDARLAVLLLFSIATLATCHRQTRSSDQSVRLFQSLSKFPYRSWLQLWGRTIGKLGNAIEDSEATEWDGLTKKGILNKLKPKIPIESSMVSEDEHANNLRIWLQRQTNTTDTSATTETPTTIPYSAFAVAAVAIAVAVAVAVPTSLQSVNPSPIQQIDFQNLFLDNDNEIPINILPLPVDGIDFQDDGCGDGSVRFDDGNCYPVLRRGPCADPFQWVTVDPNQLRVIHLAMSSKCWQTSKKGLISGEMYSTSLWSK